jgi:hypothetical protein
VRTKIFTPRSFLKKENCLMSEHHALCVYECTCPHVCFMSVSVLPLKLLNQRTDFTV